jgi:hypothetical protein
LAYRPNRRNLVLRIQLAVFHRFAKLFSISTVAEIEEAIEHLPASELRRLREKFFSHPIDAPAIKPKTGAELAEIFPNRFHLRPAEADALAAEMSSAKKSPPQSSAWE